MGERDDHYYEIVGTVPFESYVYYNHPTLPWNADSLSRCIENHPEVRQLKAEYDQNPKVLVTVVYTHRDRQYLNQGEPLFRCRLSEFQSRY
jgi:hypothetical protein